MRRQCRLAALGRNRRTGQGQGLQRAQRPDVVCRGSRLWGKRINDESRREHGHWVAARMGTMHQRVKQVARRSVILSSGILVDRRTVRVIADSTVFGVGMIGGGLGRLVNIAHRRQHRIGHHRKQQQCQRRKAQDSSELAQGACHSVRMVVSTERVRQSPDSGNGRLSRPELPRRLLSKIDRYS